LLNFGYKEFDTNDILLDREDGTIPGITFAASGNWQQWLATLKLTYNKGLIDYTGQSQNGTPLTSKTDTRILDYSFSIGQWIKYNNSNRLSIFAGYGQHSWQRNIRSTTTNNGAAISGLNEKYYWNYLLIGTNIEILIKPKSHWIIELQYNHMLDAEIDVELTGFDPITLNLGKKFGIRIASPYGYKIDDALSIKLEPFYEYWELERGEPERLRVNGIVSSLSIVEPASNTQNFGLNFLITQKF
ncbi:MAG: hypothetical protein ACC657_14535, partial [Thiohalomonadales bacterium]